jgi:hypothetical protein
LKKLNLTKSLLITICACLCAVIVGVILFVNKDTIISTISAASDDAVFSDSLNFSAPNGYIHRKLDSTGGFLLFDYKTLKSGSLWGSASASAFERGTMPTVLAVYKNFTYVLVTDGQTSAIYKVSMDGRTRTVIDKINSQTGGRILIANGKLYYEKIERKTDSSGKITGDTTVSINALNLSNNKDSRVSPAHTGKNASITLSGNYKDCIYYIYTSASSGTTNSKHAIYECNTKTGKESTILSSIGKQSVLKFYKGNVYYILNNPTTHINTLYSYNLGTKKTYKIVSNMNLINSFQCFDNKIFYRLGSSDGSTVSQSTQKEGFCYDLKTKDTYSVPIMNSDKEYLYIVNESKDLFILTCQNVGDNGQVKDSSFAYIKKSDYLAGKTNTTKFD